MSLRIGAVSYLNTKPLIHGLTDRLPNCELILDLPSRLAERLSAGDLDIALIPSVEFLRGHEELQIVSNACIACRGAVRSVQLLFRVPPQSVQSIAMDVGSRTSAAMSQVLLYERYGLRPTISILPIEADFYLDDSDALLVIGDRAMKIQSERFQECWDLGAHWNQWSGLPFVFAMWVARSSAVGDSWLLEVTAALEACRDEGLANAKNLAARFAPDYHLSTEDCLLYFTEQLHFNLGKSERAGLDLFHQHLRLLGLLATQSACHSQSSMVNNVVEVSRPNPNRSNY
jgi:chorismate dehydratase